MLVALLNGIPEIQDSVSSVRTGKGVTDCLIPEKWPFKKLIIIGSFDSSMRQQRHRVAQDSANNRSSPFPLPRP